LRWTRPESLHITLHYFGPTPQAALAECQTALGEVVQKAQKIPVRLYAPTLFPHSRKARGLWIEVGDPTGALHRLHADLVQALQHLGLPCDPKLQHLGLPCDPKLQHLGLPCDPKRFHPHVTLGRIPSRLRGSRRREAVAVLRQTVAHGSVPMTADTIAQMHWYQSLPQPRGNIYKPLTTWRFDMS